MPQTESLVLVTPFTVLSLLAFMNVAIVDAKKVIWREKGKTESRPRRTGG